MTEYYLNDEARRAKKILKARGVNLSHIVQNALIKEAGLKEAVNPYKEQMKAIKEQSKKWDEQNKQTAQVEHLKFRKETAVKFRSACNDLDYETCKELLKLINKRLSKQFKILNELDKNFDPYSWWLEHYDAL